MIYFIRSGTRRIKTAVQWLLISPVILYILAVQLWERHSALEGVGDKGET